MQKTKTDCFAYRAEKGGYCAVLIDEASCRGCKFYKTWGKYTADLKAAEERVKRISGT